MISLHSAVAWMDLQWHPGTMPELDSDTAKADSCERQPALKIFQDTLWKGKSYLKTSIISITSTVCDLLLGSFL
jgi:hypothetical protein